MTKTEKVDKDIVKTIEKSSKKFKQLYPILVDANGELIDGKHRKAVFKNADTKKLDFIKSKKDRLQARLVANHARRGQNKATWEFTLNELGKILEREGVESIGMKIAEETGLPYRTLMRYLPSQFKNQAQSKRASHSRLPSGTPLPEEAESEAQDTASAKSLVQSPAETDTQGIMNLSPAEGNTPAEILEGFSEVAEKERPKIEIKKFSNQPWKMIILPKDFFDKLETACMKSRLDMEEVVTLALMKVLEDLRKANRCLEKEL